MKLQAIDRLGVVSYGGLILGIVNSLIQNGVSREALDSWAVLIPLLAVNSVGGIAASIASS